MSVPARKDVVGLHKLPLVIQVKCQKRPDTGEIGNEIKGYAKKEAPASAAGTQPQVNSTPPWRRS